MCRAGRLLECHRPWLRRLAAWTADGSSGGGESITQWTTLGALWPAAAATALEIAQETGAQGPAASALRLPALLADTAHGLVLTLPASALPREFAALLWAQAVIRSFEAVRSAAQRTQLGTDVVKALHTAFFAPGGGSGGSAAATLFVTHAASHFAALGSPERSQLKLMRIITAAKRCNITRGGSIG